MRKNIVLLVVLVLIATSLFSCTSNPKSSVPASSSETSSESSAPTVGEPVKLTFMNWGSAEEATLPAFKAMINKFNETHPEIQVASVSEPFNSSLEKLLVLNASKQAPDIMQIHSSWTAALQGAGALANLDSLLSKDLLADFYPNTLDALKYNGSQYALPWSPTPAVLFYNKELMKKAGYTEPPKTIDELSKMATAISGLGADANGNTIYGVGIQSKAINMTGIHFLYYLWSFGGEVVDKDGKVNINSPETVNAFKFVKSLMDSKASPVGLEIKELRSLFSQGSLGFYIDGADYGLNAIRKLAKDPKVFMQHTGVATLPTSTSASPGGNSFFIEHNLGISSNCKYPKAAFTFIEWLTATEAVQIFNDTIGNKMPSRYSVAKLNYYVNGDDPNMPIIMQALGKARSLPEKNTGFNEGMVAIANAIQQVCLNNGDPTTVVANLAEQLKKIYGS